MSRTEESKKKLIEFQNESKKIQSQGKAISEAKAEAA
jgi:hypothetical protein